MVYHIVSCAKVGSGTMKESIPGAILYHEVWTVRDVLENRTNDTILVGIRDPVARNLSYFFQTFRNKFYNQVQTEKNKNKGEYCYVPELDKDDLTSDEIISHFLKQPNLHTFNDWFEEFLEYSGITEFDKERGYQVYDYPNGNRILVYTLEKLKDNEKDICELLNIKEIRVSNQSKHKWYADLYKETKEKIIYPKSYLDSLLNTDIIKLFYTDEQINKFYQSHQRLVPFSE